MRPRTSARFRSWAGFRRSEPSSGKQFTKRPGLERLILLRPTIIDLPRYGTPAANQMLAPVSPHISSPVESEPNISAPAIDPFTQPNSDWLPGLPQFPLDENVPTLEESNQPRVIPESGTDQSSAAPRKPSFGQRLGKAGSSMKSAWSRATIRMTGGSKR